MSARSSRELLALGLLGCLVIAALLALGVWQLQRREWKLALIDRVEHRVHAPAAPAPGPDRWPLIDRAHDEYRRVSVAGHWLNERETLVSALTELGSGFWVLTPLRTDAGFVVLVNRGFVPPERRSPAARPESTGTDEAQVTGLLRITEPNGAFLRANQPATGRWYSRDVRAIAAAQALPDVAPYFIDADATPLPGGWPVGGLTVIAFPNNHLVYALTWFALASLLAGALLHHLPRASRRAPRLNRGR